MNFTTKRLLSLFVLVLLSLTPVAAQDPTFIGPLQSSLDPADPNGASGGRVNGLAAVPGLWDVAYAASEWGGLFKTIDAGLTWTHLDAHVPQATWDVAVPREDMGTPSEKVYATSFYDGRLEPGSGINISTNGGMSWTRPDQRPPFGFCATEILREEPSGFGIAIDPVDADNVFVGTNCGLRVTSDGGVNWRSIDPTPTTPATTIWDVVSWGNGLVDICGDDGHRRSFDGGATWSTEVLGSLPSGRCSLAGSPLEKDVLFAIVGVSTIYETTNGGAEWVPAYGVPDPDPAGRIPFVLTNPRAGGSFDLWYGDVGLYRMTCGSDPLPSVGGSLRCFVDWAGPFTDTVGGHNDVGDLTFVPREMSRDACPGLYSSDGGVYYNLATTGPDCHSPRWEQPDETVTALWQFDLDGSRLPGVEPEDLYLANQDNGSFGTRDGGSDDVDWINEWCCDGFDISASATNVVSTICCFGPAGVTAMFLSPPGLGMPGDVDPPPGTLLSFEQLDSIITFGPESFAVVTTTGVYYTTQISALDPEWTAIGSATVPSGACALDYANTSAGEPVFFVKAGGCSGDEGATLWKHVGLSGGVWEEVTRTEGGLFGVYDVWGRNADLIIASDLANDPPEMVLTDDGGDTWRSLVTLDDAMTGGGRFRYVTRVGPTAFTGFDGYPQPTLVAIDPRDSRILVAGGADSGVFVSVDRGDTWDVVTDPFTPGETGTVHLPRPRYVHFDHDGGMIRAYIGTQGRGVWRLEIESP